MDKDARPLYFVCMYEIRKFTNGPLSAEVRTLLIEGIVWFVLVDVARSLGYRDATAARHLLRVSQVVQADDAIKKALGVRGSAPYLVNESGFYRLALSSTKEEAKGFQLWVEDDVLTSIRRDGAYVSEGITQEQFDAVVAKYEARVDRIVEGARKREISIVREADLTEKNKQENIDEAWGQNHFLGEYLKYLRDFTVHGSSRDAMTQPQFRKNRYQG